MQTVQNTSKPITKDKRKQGFCFKKTFENFAKNHKESLLKVNTLLKQSLNDNKSLQEMTTKQRITTKGLQEIIVKKDEEMAKQQENLTILTQEFESFKLRSREFEQKYVILEETYDRNVLVLKTEIETLHKAIAAYESMELELITELVAVQKQSQLQLTAKTTECLSLNDKILELQNDFENAKKLEQTVTAYEMKLASYEQDLKSLAQYKNETEELKLQLKLKQESFEKYQQEKAENEKAKQRIIDEQAFKIRKIERAVEQRIKCIQPTNAAPEETALESIQTIQHAEPQQNLSTPTVIRHVNRITNTTQHNVTRHQISQMQVSQNRKIVHALTHAVGANVNISSALNPSTPATTTLNNQVENRTSPLNRSSPSNSVFSQDDESLQNWRPQFLPDSEISETPRGFNITRRSFNNNKRSYSYVDDSSDSGGANQPKHLKM